MVGGHQELDDRAAESGGPIRCHLGGFAVETDRRGEEQGGRLHIAFGETITSMTCPCWSTAVRLLTAKLWPDLGDLLGEDDQG